MTDDDLKALEIVCDVNDGEKYIEARTDMTPACRRLIAEVRRLRGLVKRMEWIADDMGVFCRYCDNAQFAGHRADCMAFTESGKVR